MSLMHSVIKPEQLFIKAKELEQSAIAVTDRASMAATWDSFKASKKHGIKLIIGCEFNFVDDLEIKTKSSNLVLLAKNHTGYKNLLKLHKLANDNNIILFGKVHPLIDWKLLEDHSEGLICTTGTASGILGNLINTRKSDKAFENAKRLKTIFGESLAFEIQPHALVRNASPYNDYEDQTLVNKKLIDFAEKLNVKIIATTNAQYVTKDQWKAHDTVLAVGSGMPVKSVARPKYPAHEFYIKSRDEIVAFFSRHYGEKAEEFCDNTLYFAALCEEPEWIDPKFSNPSGKELPEFPVNKQDDYEIFKQWLVLQSDKIKNLSIDKAYLRYWCELGIKNKKIINPEYIKRLEAELEVYEALNFSSYMLIVADYVNWAKNNNIPVGVGRGCLHGDAKVLTSNGFKILSEVNTNDCVYSHTGNIRNVLASYKYDCKENLLKIKSEFSFDHISLTKDHLVYACRREYEYNKIKCCSNPTWIQASHLSVGDYIYFTFPIRNISASNIYINLSDLGINKKDLLTINHSINNLSCRHISRNINVSYSFINNVKMKKVFKTEINKHLFKELGQYLYLHNLSIDDWIELDNFSTVELPATIEVDEDFMYLLGRWVGDGCFNHEHGITIANNQLDGVGTAKVVKILNKFGLYAGIYNSKKSNGMNITVSNKALFLLFKYLFPFYKDSSTKYLPNFFRELPDNLLLSLLNGIIESDGYSLNGKFKIKTISEKLALDIKELLAYLKIPCSICIEKNPKRYGKSTKPSYSILFYLDIKRAGVHVCGNGYFAKITELSEITTDVVYDISVENDTSYLTTNGIVHNSGGGSIVGYLTNIHQADPIKYELIFERFINKEKTSFPDLDVDFSSDGKIKVEEYIVAKYGRDNVAHVSNISHITPKVYARDIARACGFGENRAASVELGTLIADSIPDTTKSINSALESAPLFSEFANKYPELKEFADVISGLPRAWATHAGGIIIGRRPLHEIVPVRRDKEGNYAIEYDKDNAEENGLVKMDILGLSTLDNIANTIKIIEMSGQSMPAGLIDYDQFDTKTSDLISNGDTLCVFQLGTSAGTIDLCKKIKPKSIDDIAIINSLARPSARGMREAFVKTKNGESAMNIIHPSLNRAFGKTYGFGLYEECLFYIAQDVAKWDLNKADRLRKLTKDKGKNPEKAKQLRKEFIDDATIYIGDKKMATKIWDEVIDLFQGYGFNRAHAIFYSMLGYQTAYLKTNYPVAFMTANLISEDASNAKIADKKITKIKREMRKSGINILVPDINKSNEVYNILDSKNILTGFNSLKYMGNDAIPDIIAKRPFSSFDDFMRRIDARKVRITAVQALIGSGCFDCFGMPRKQMFLYVSDYRKKLQAWKKKATVFEYPWPEVGEWNNQEKYAMELFYMGEAFSCGFKEAYPNFFDKHAINFSTLTDIFPNTGSGESKYLSYDDGAIEGVIVDYFEFKVKNDKSKIFGEVMAKADIEDLWGNIITITMFPSSLENFKTRLRLLLGNKAVIEPGIAIHCNAKMNWYEDNLTLIFDDLIKAAPIPILPKDKEHKKVLMKSSTKRAKSKKIDKNDLMDIVNAEMILDGYWSEQ